jgi:hypothetical protein
MYWYDGGLSPMILADVPRPDGDGGGAIFIGEKGYLTHQTYGDNPKIFPASLAAEAERLPKTFERVDTGHEVNWARACKGEARASCPWSLNASPKRLDRSSSSSAFDNAAFMLKISRPSNQLAQVIK